MPYAVAFWVLMLLWLVLGIFNSWPNWHLGLPNIILFLLLCLLGWKVFGAALHG